MGRPPLAAGTLGAGCGRIARPAADLPENPYRPTDAGNRGLPPGIDAGPDRPPGTVRGVEKPRLRVYAAAPARHGLTGAGIRRDFRNNPASPRTARHEGDAG